MNFINPLLVYSISANEFVYKFSLRIMANESGWVPLSKRPPVYVHVLKQAYISSRQLGDRRHIHTTELSTETVACCATHNGCSSKLLVDLGRERLM